MYSLSLVSVVMLDVVQPTPTVYNIFLQYFLAIYCWYTYNNKQRRNNPHYGTFKENLRLNLDLKIAAFYSSQQRQSFWDYIFFLPNHAHENTLWKSHWMNWMFVYNTKEHSHSSSTCHCQNFPFQCIYNIWITTGRQAFFNSNILSVPDTGKPITHMANAMSYFSYLPVTMLHTNNFQTHMSYITVETVS